MKITFQGIPCISATAVRTTGIDPDFAEVVIPRRDLSSIEVIEDRDLFGSFSGPSATTTVREPESSGAVSLDQALTKKLLVSGDLVFEGAKQSKVTLKNLYLRDEGVEQVHDDRIGQDIVRLRLADIRYFWRSRGELWGEFNRRRPDGLFYLNTLNIFRQRCTLFLLMTRIFEALPGRLSFRALDTAALDILTTPVRNEVTWAGLSPVEVLGDLLREYGLALHLDLDGRTVYFSKSSLVSAATAKRATNDIVRVFKGVSNNSAQVAPGEYRVKARTRVNYPPTSVRVLGGPIYLETRRRMLAVGIHADTKKIVPLDEAAESYGMSLVDLGRWILLSEDEQETAFDGIAAGKSKELRRWAFKWYQLRPSDWGVLPFERQRVAQMREKAADRIRSEEVPSVEVEATTYRVFLTFPKSSAEAMENAVAVIDARVRARLGEIDAAQLIRDAEERGERERARGYIGWYEADKYVREAQAKIREHYERAERLKRSYLQQLLLYGAVRREDGATVPRDELLKTNRPGQIILDGLGIDTSPREVPVATTSSPANVDAIAAAAIEGLSENLKRSAGYVVHNVTASATEFDVDHERGMVKFPVPVGVYYTSRDRYIVALANLDTANGYTEELLVTEGAVCGTTGSVEDGYLAPGVVYVTFAFKTKPEVYYEAAQRNSIVSPSVIEYPASTYFGVAATRQATVASRVALLVEGDPPKVRNVTASRADGFYYNGDDGSRTNFQPARVIRDDLTLYVDIDGNTNYEEIEREAIDIASAMMSIPGTVNSVECTTFKPVPIPTNDLVREVRWEMDGEGAKTVWFEGSEGPYSEGKS